MATWTVVIKFLAPVLYAVAERASGNDAATAPVLWDFWWVAHLALAHLFWHRHRAARWVGLAVAWTEVVIVAVKFYRFLQDPDWTFWRLLWFTNKVYVLAFFLVLGFWLLTDRFRRQLEEMPT